jgi:hypothetical protein
MIWNVIFAACIVWAGLVIGHVWWDLLNLWLYGMRPGRCRKWYCPEHWLRWLRDLKSQL